MYLLVPKKPAALLKKTWQPVECKKICVAGWGPIFTFRPCDGVYQKHSGQVVFLKGKIIKINK